MNKVQEEKLNNLLNDRQLVEALEEVFYGVINKKLPVVTPNQDDRQIGQTYRAYVIAKELLNLGFQKLHEYKIPEKETPDFEKSE